MLGNLNYKLLTSIVIFGVVMLYISCLMIRCCTKVMCFVYAGQAIKSSRWKSKANTIATDSKERIWSKSWANFLSCWRITNSNI